MVSFGRCETSLAIGYNILFHITTCEIKLGHMESMFPPPYIYSQYKAQLLVR